MTHHFDNILLLFVNKYARMSNSHRKVVYNDTAHSYSKMYGIQDAEYLPDLIHPVIQIGKKYARFGNPTIAIKWTDHGIDS